VNSLLVSVILPIHNERENLGPLLSEIRQALGGMPHEVVAVDDGSTDGSLGELERLAAADPRLRIVALEPRAGQSAAFAAGFDAARGEIVVTMDADGQHDPADVPRMLALLESTAAVSAVAGFRTPRTDSRWKRVQSAIANSVRDRLTGDRVRDSACSLRVMRRSVVLGLPRFDGMHRFLPTLIRLNGGMVVQVPVTHRRRRHGQSKYGMLDRAMRGLIDAIGVRWLKRRALRYTVKPVRNGQA
jgi:glycosyltransferase involved in cell wall biosynthesis